MWHSKTNGHDQTHDDVAVGLWVLAGIIAVVVLADSLVLLAGVLAIVAGAGGLYRAVERRADGAAMALAPVTPLRPAWAEQRDVKATAVPAPWRDPSAA